MTKLSIITFIIFLIGCTDDKLKQAFPNVNRNDINQIAEVVIRQDSMPFHKSSDTSFVPLSASLRKIFITTQDTTPDIPPPVDRQTVPLYKLLNSLVKHERFFEWRDTSYFYFQNNLTDTFTLDKALSEKVVITDLVTKNAKFDNKLLTRYYDLTIPIFSKNQTRAYVELTNNCNDCGGATAFYLEKINGKWTVVGWNRLWMN